MTKPKAESQVKVSIIMLHDVFPVFFRVQGDPHLSYESVMNSTGFCWSTFPIKSSQMSQLVVSLNVSNSLGSKTSGPHTFTLRNIGKELIISNIKTVKPFNCI